MKHSGSIKSNVISSQHRRTEIAEGFEMPCVLRFYGRSGDDWKAEIFTLGK